MPPSRKKIITEFAANLFRLKGYSATSMRDIADQVGIEAASLYNHIKSKHELLQIIVFNVANICNEHLSYVKQQTDPAAQIESIIRFHVKLMINNYNYYFVMTHDWKSLTEPDLTTFMQQRRTYVQDVELIVQQGIDKKIFKPISPYVVVLNILSSVMGLEFWHRSNKRYNETEMEDSIVLHLLSGLLK
jgi:TetR/AcrR family transcriptional regulator, cholesterol catabolism regulator